MTKKDFEAIAATFAAFRAISTAEERVTVDALAKLMATTCAAEYKGSYSFKREKFLRACGSPE